MASYDVLRVHTPLSLDAASAIVDGALKHARDNNIEPLTVVVLDIGGNMVAFKREDGSGIVRHDIAIGKAWGALGMGISSRTIMERTKDRPAFAGAVAAASQGRFVPVPGGVLIIGQDDTVVGAVGISGDTSEKDEYCAITAVQEAGFRTSPEAPVENWRG